MITVAGGDSFIFGSELQSQANTFFALVSKKYQYCCTAWPGIGNDGISRRVIETVETLGNEKIIVVVNWTFPGRYEFRFSYDTGQKTREWYSITPWTTKDINSIKAEFITQNNEILTDHHATLARAKTTGVFDFAQMFYKHVGGSEYWEVYSTLKEIVYLQNYLKAKNIPYLFTCADNSILDNYTFKNADLTIQSLARQITNDEKNWFWFPAGIKQNETCAPRGFYQWALENKYPMGTTHPLEQAHMDASHLIREKFDELVKKHME